MGDVRFARDEAERAGQRCRARAPGGPDAFPFSAYVLIRGLSAASSYVSERTSGEVASHAAVDLVRWCASAENERREEAKAASEASSFAWDSPSPATRAYAFSADAIAETITRDGEREVLAEYADLVRRIVPYPFFESRYWEPRDARVLVETTVLKRNGWRCEAVQRPTPQADRTGTWH